ncbi:MULTISPECIES: type II toxin-antitoxin system VapC family toxin [unclassified Luteococcus]|uniref:type II toxin-antitoxin system VapC family toxin n=1 Tax=unclassified Luteococcus TaxID=2639923 RepID=UPI00313C6AC8
MSVVLDASLPLAWLLHEVSDEELDVVLDEVLHDGGLVTPLWQLEVLNGLLVAVKRGRITTAQLSEMLVALEGLPLEQVELDPSPYALLPLAREHGLTAYDASYVWAASVTGCPLATRDEKMRAAAEAEGIALLG